MEVKKREKNNVIIFDIIGNFQKSSPKLNTLHQQVKEQLNKEKRNFLINLEKVNFIDTHGIAEILTCLISVFNFGGELKLYPLKFFVEQKIPVDHRIEVFDDEEKAINSFSK